MSSNLARGTFSEVRQKELAPPLSHPHQLPGYPAFVIGTLKKRRANQAQEVVRRKKQLSNPLPLVLGSVVGKKGERREEWGFLGAQEQ